MKKIIMLCVFISLAFATKYQDTDKKYTKETKQLKQTYYTDDNISLHSPAFSKPWSNKSKFTSYDEMIEFISNISKTNSWANLKFFGRSQENQKIPYLFLSNNTNDKNKIRIWLQGGIHGNEPAGAEGMLALLGQMNKNKKQINNWLEKANIILVPRFNIDGTKYFQRRSARNIDFNRDHVKLQVPEMKIIKKVFNKFAPHVVVDNHEYTTYRKELKKLGKKGFAVPYDALYASARNLNLDVKIRNLANELVINDIKKVLDKNKLSHQVYGTYKYKNKKITGLEGGTVARIGRNAAGLSNAISILLETRGVAIGKQNFPRRVFTQVLMNESILNTAVNNKELITSTINEAVKKLINDGKNSTNNIIVKSTRKVGKKDFKFIEIKDSKVIDVNIDYKYSSQEIPTLVRKRPKAYIIPASFSYVSDLIKNLGLKVKILKQEQTLNVEAFKIISNKVSKKLYEGEFRNTLKSKLVKRTLTFPIGSAIVSMAQKNANLAMLALEPDSSDSFATFNIVPVVKNDQFPIFRMYE